MARERVFARSESDVAISGGSEEIPTTGVRTGLGMTWILWYPYPV